MAVQWLVHLLFVLTGDDASACAHALAHNTLRTAYTLAQTRAISPGAACILVQSLFHLLGVAVRLLEGGDVMECRACVGPYVNASVSELLSATQEGLHETADLVCLCGVAICYLSSRL